MKNQQTKPIIAVLSDTHDQVDNLLKVIAYINEHKIDLVVHCGDWVSPFTLSRYKEIDAPIIGVFGNNDGDIYRHVEYSKNLELELERGIYFLTKVAWDKRFAVYHGDHPEIVEALVSCGIYDVVFSGHNHVAEIRKKNDVLFLNPGSLMNCEHERGASFGLYYPNSHDGKIIYLGDL